MHHGWITPTAWPEKACFHHHSIWPICNIALCEECQGLRYSVPPGLFFSIMLFKIQKPKELYWFLDWHWSYYTCFSNIRIHNNCYFLNKCICYDVFIVLHREILHLLARDKSSSVILPWLFGLLNLPPHNEVLFKVPAPVNAVDSC